MRTFFDILRDNRGFVDNEGEEEATDAAEDLLELDDEEEDDDSGDIEVDLSDDEEEEAPSNKAFAAMRVENRDLKAAVDNLTATVESLKSQPASQQTTYVPPDIDDPRKWTEEQWDSLAKSDWKKAVDLRSQIQAEDKINKNRTTAEFNRTLEESKQRVLTRHPELNDPNSEKSKIYRNIVTANPEYTMQKKGPVNAMYEMEDYMEKNMGYKRDEIVKAERIGRESEAERLNRIQLTSTTGHNLTEGSKVTITKDELDFCKLQGIDPKVYAANKKRLEKSGKGGIQL